jgi:hypothetical protein
MIRVDPGWSSSREPEEGLFLQRGQKALLGPFRFTKTKCLMIGHWLIPPQAAACALAGTATMHSPSLSGKKFINRQVIQKQSFGE